MSLDPQGIIRSIYNRAIFRTLIDLEPEVSSVACRQYQMIKHIQSPGIDNRFFKHYQGYLKVFRDIDAYSSTLTDAQLVEGRLMQAYSAILSNMCNPRMFIAVPYSEP